MNDLNKDYSHRMKVVNENVKFLIIEMMEENQNIGLVRNFSRFFRKFPGTIEEVLEGSIVRVYIGGTNIFRRTIKLWKWTLILN